MNSDNKFIDQNGGKLIAQGSHGCVYDPALSCKASPIPLPGKVSKLLTKTNAHLELRKHKKIDKIDSKFYYHLPAPQMCIPNRLTKQTKKKLEKCKAVNVSRMRNWQEETRLLQYNYGGIPLSNFINTTVKLDIPKLLIGLTPLMRGIVEFQENGIGHFDIKTDNILIDPKTYNCRFIDFGSSTRYSDFSPKNPEYWIYPNEIVFLTQPINISKRLKKINRDPTIYYETLWSLEESVKANAFVGQHRIFYENFIRSPNRFADILTDDSLVQFYLHDYKQRGTQEINRAIIKGLDTYAMGLVLVEIWNLITRKKFDFFAVLPENECSYLDILFLCIKNMIHPCYQLRASPETAERWYNLVVKEQSLKCEKSKTVKRNNHNRNRQKNTIKKHNKNNTTRKHKKRNQ